jgi:phosphatidylcholine synthase
MTHAGPGSRGHSAPRWIAAWAAHAVTASGAIWGLLALVAATEADWKATFVWMVIAVAVDSFDGMLARAARVKEVTPAFDGALLDTTLDYLNYVFVPAFVLYRADLLPPGLALAGASVVCLSSAFQFCHKDAKTDDHFFRGFPSFWNVLAFYLFLGGLDRWLNLMLVVVLAGLAFVPLKWIYPSRMTRWRGLTIALTAIWGLTCVWMLAWFPSPPLWLLLGSLGYVAYYMVASLYLSRSEP